MKNYSFLKKPVVFALLVVVAWAISAFSTSTTAWTAYGVVEDDPTTPGYDAHCELGNLIQDECGQNGGFQCTVVIQGRMYPAYSIDLGVVCSTPEFYF